MNNYKLSGIFKVILEESMPVYLRIVYPYRFYITFTHNYTVLNI